MTKSDQIVLVVKAYCNITKDLKGRRGDIVAAKHIIAYFLDKKLLMHPIDIANILKCHRTNIYYMLKTIKNDMKNRDWMSKYGELIKQLDNLQWNN